MINGNVKLIKTTSLDIQIKNNPLAKKAPTVKTFYLIEKSDSLIKMRVNSCTKKGSIPYSDYFCIDEEIILYRPPEAPQDSCLLRITMKPILFKYTMINKIITTNANKEAKRIWTAYQAYLKKNGHLVKDLMESSLKKSM